MKLPMPVLILLGLLAIAIVAFMVLRIVGGGPPRPVRTQESSALVGAAPLDAYRVPTDRPERRGTMRMMVDSSGSMAGFSGAMPVLTTWLANAVSHLQTYGFTPSTLERCSFNTSTGVSCSGSAAAFRSISFSSDTNLDDAVRAASTSDLAFILTDGVAASGSRPSRHCADGVDAACVARALRTLVRPDHGFRAATESPGIWLVPLTVPFDGTYYAERRASVDEVDYRAIATRVADDTGAAAITVSDARNLRDGTVAYRYAGPRPVLLIVMAKSADVGRAAAVALATTATKEGLAVYHEARVAPTIGTGPVFEVYPGYLAEAVVAQLEPWDELPQGTIHATLEGSTVRVECQASMTNSARYTLTAVRPGDRDGIAGIRLQSVAAVQPQLHDAGSIESLRETELSLDVHEGRLVMQTRILCSDTIPAACDESSQVDVHALFDYASTARILAGGRDPFGLSTDDPVREPHRVFALRSLLQVFYEELSNDPSIVSITRLAVCRD